MASADKILDYDAMVADYTVNLDATLRNFRPADDLLDTWVPDDDAGRSLCSLVEAAQIGGRDSVAVRVSTRALEGRDADSLRDTLASLGEAAFTQDNGMVVFTIAKLQETAAFRSVRAIYQPRLRARAGKLHFRRPLNVSADSISLRATDGSLSLAWAVRTTDHVVTDAVHDGSGSGPQAAALDALCELVIGLPIQEARDHGMVRVEFALRDPKQRHAITGVVLPLNADPVFRQPASLVARLFQDYQTSTQYRPQPNYFDPGVKPAWAALTPVERARKVTDAIAASAATLGLKPVDVRVIECNHDYAATIHFDGELTIPQKRAAALAIERVAREHCDPRLEIFCEEKKDLSKLRRLTETGDKP